MTDKYLIGYPIDQNLAYVGEFLIGLSSLLLHHRDSLVTFCCSKNVLIITARINMLKHPGVYTLFDNHTAKIKQEDLSLLFLLGMRFCRVCESEQ